MHTTYPFISLRNAYDLKSIALNLAALKDITGEVRDSRDTASSTAIGLQALLNPIGRTKLATLNDEQIMLSATKRFLDVPYTIILAKGGSYGVGTTTFFDASMGEIKNEVCWRPNAYIKNKINQLVSNFGLIADDAKIIESNITIDYQTNISF